MLQAIMGRKVSKTNRKTLRGRFGARLQELRAEKYPRQTDFAAALRKRGMKATEQAVSYWERGARVPPLNHWPKIADALGVHLRDLLPPQ